MKTSEMKRDNVLISIDIYNPTAINATHRHWMVKIKIWGHVRTYMTSAKFSGLLTPPPLSAIWTNS